MYPASVEPSRSDIYAPLPGDRKRLRIGTMIESFRQPAWVAAMLEEVAASGAGDITTVIRQAPGGRSSRWRGATDGWNTLVHTACAWVDHALAARWSDRLEPFAPTDVAPLLGNAKIIDVRPIVDGSVNCFTSADVERIRREGLDVILRLGVGILGGDILSAARFGIWSYDHGDNGASRGRLPPFREMADNGMTGGAILRILDETMDSGRVIYRSPAAVRPGSPFRDLCQAYAKSSAFVARRLRDIQRYGDTAVSKWSEDSRLKAGGGQRPFDGLPARGTTLRILATGAVRRILLRPWSRRGDQWFLALRKRPQAFLNDGVAGDLLQGFTPLPVASGYFHADPFLLERDGVTHLFFERFDYSRRKGAIAHCVLDAGGVPSAPRVVLSRPYHLSYPFLFDWNGQFYMVPETGQNRTVELFRCDRFPDRWSLDRVLLQGWRAVDATMHCDESGRWWMFVTIDERGGGTCDELFLFQADAPIGPWRAHPRNPVVSDVRHARPAGRLFRRAGSLIRPAQDCSRQYGGALWLMEVLELTPDRYGERALLRLGPELLPGCKRLHHLDATERFEIIDSVG